MNLLLGGLETAATVDKVNTWMLVATGATVALIISNIDQVISSSQNFVPKLLLMLLAISALFGFLAKILGVKSLSMQIAFQSILKTFESAGETDVELALKDYISAYPKLTQKIMTRSAEKGRGDPLYGFKKAANIAIRQSIYTMCQALTFIAFIVTAACGLH
tara:strand:- start:3239 stop:3724 length:486 start_codon:yes stop_codon:yes gene_type:complete